MKRAERDEAGKTATVGSYLGDRLEQAGIRHFFTVPGDFNLLLLDQLLKNPRLQMVGCCNELNAGYAADGYARSNGLAALVLTFSVGGLSALNAVACAYAEDLPILVVIGSVNSQSDLHGRPIHHSLGEIRFDYQRRIYDEVTAGTFTINRAVDAPGVIDRALDLAIRRRKPVMIEIACDVAPLPVCPPRPRQFGQMPMSDPVALRDAVERTAAMFERAKRPVLVGGSKLRYPGAADSFLSLANATGYPVAVMPGGKGMFPEDHPAFAGLYWGPVSDAGVATLVEESDCALFAGTLLSDYATAGFTTTIDSDRRIVAMPEEIQLPGAVYTGVGLGDFLSVLSVRGRREHGTRQSDQTVPPEAPAVPASDTKLTIKEVARQVRTLLGAGTTLLVETGDSWFHGLETRLPAGCAFEIQFQAGSIGWSVPASLGYELGSSGPRRVVALIGDGSFQLTAQEVSTMIRLGTRPILILINNHGYIIEDAIHEGPYNKIKNWDYAGLMGVFTNREGAGLGLPARTSGELASAIETARNHQGPCLIEVSIDPTDFSPRLSKWGDLVAAANGKHGN